MREVLRASVAARREWVASTTARLVAIPSPNPPLDTRDVAAAAAELVREVAPGAELEVIELDHGVTNLVAVLRGRGAGKRVVFSGHLDTYPLLEELPWTVDPLGGARRDGRIYGRGACDMKGGIAAALAAFGALAETRAEWPGEVVLALSGDEESMGTLGARWLLDNRAAVRGDAVLIPDVGSPAVVRCGEKGFLWFELEAAGKAAHGAHVHLGENAAERLMEGLRAVLSLRDMPLATPPAIAETIRVAAPVSEKLAGAGESEVLRSVTVNIGQVEAGTSPNLVPASARARGDIRLPLGVSTAEAEAFLRRALEAVPGVTLRILRRTEPSWTDPAHAVVRAVVAAAAEARGEAPVVNMRVGGSDARVFRADGLPTVVYGPTPHGLGGVDEFVELDELMVVAETYALAAWDLLRG
jgi:acetylornithine deacetylase/succinyl-diaminopimelate desuccinylase-like protein